MPVHRKINISISTQRVHKSEGRLTFLYSGSSIFWIIELSSFRIALAETPVAADLKSYVEPYNFVSVLYGIPMNCCAIVESSE